MEEKWRQRIPRNFMVYSTGHHINADYPHFQLLLKLLYDFHGKNLLKIKGHISRDQNITKLSKKISCQVASWIPDEKLTHLREISPIAVTFISFPSSKRDENSVLSVYNKGLARKGSRLHTHHLNTYQKSISGALLSRTLNITTAHLIFGPKIF